MKLSKVTKSVLLSVSLLCYAGILYSQQIAFPGAEGYGKYTVGGRGGAVYEVTTLNPTGAGSLGGAIGTSGARTVVFKVSGTITGNFNISNGNITIAGQTAPGDGICIRGNLSISADNVIIRYIRVRFDPSTGENDAIGGRYHKNIILDHVSASWSTDEVMTSYHNENVTIQWCMITEACAKFVDGENTGHRFGGIWGNNYGTWHHNLFAHNDSRNPRWASGCGNNDYRNNVLYNWGYASCYGGEAYGDDNHTFSTINMVANYYKPGPATQSGVKSCIVDPSTRDGEADAGKWWVSDNYVDGNPSVTSDNWLGVTKTSSAFRLDKAWPFMPIAQQTAEDAYLAVLDGAGCSFPNRDSVDARIIEEVRTGTATYGNNGIITFATDVGGWPVLASGTPYTDDDHDGMSDDWETANGLNPGDPADRNDIGEGGFTNLEIFLCELIGDGGPVTGLSVLPATATVGLVDTQQLWALIKPVNASNNHITWSSSDTTIAKVNAAGLVSGIAVGSVDIMANTQDGGFMDTCSVSVADIPSYKLTVSLNGEGEVSPDSGTYFKGDVVLIFVNVPDDTWVFDGWSEDVSGKNNPLYLTVDTTKSLTANFTQVLKGYSFCSNENQTCTFSGLVNIAYGAKGKFYIKYNQSGGIIACNNETFGDPISGQSKSCYVQPAVMVEGVSVSPETVTLNIDSSAQLTATVSPDNATNKNVRWSSNKYSVATVDNLGLVRGKAEGSAVITVSTKDGGFKATADITVLEPTSIAKIESDQDIVIYPVPFNKRLNIQFGQELTETVDIFLLDATGRIVKYKRAAGLNHQLDVMDLNEGLYLVKIVGNTINSVEMIIKTR